MMSPESSAGSGPRAPRWLRGWADRVAAQPLDRALRGGVRLGWWAGTGARYRRAEARTALERAFPDWPRRKREAVLDGVYAHLGMNLVEILRLAGGCRDQLETRTSFHGLDHLQAALARGRGALLLSGHCGNWDLMTAALSRGKLPPVTIITRGIRNPGIHTFWMEHLSRQGIRCVPARRSLRGCLSALRRNELVGFMLDQNRKAPEGVFVDFFGRPACTAPGLAYLSYLAQAPVVPVFARREPDPTRHECQVHPFLEPVTDRRPETIRDATQRYTYAVEAHIRSHPDQWIWIHRRWRTQPPETGTG